MKFFNTTLLVFIAIIAYVAANSSGFLQQKTLANYELTTENENGSSLDELAEFADHLLGSLLSGFPVQPQVQDNKLRIESKRLSDNQNFIIQNQRSEKPKKKRNGN